VVRRRTASGPQRLIAPPEAASAAAASGRPAPAAARTSPRRSITDSIAAAAAAGATREDLAGTRPAGALAVMARGAVADGTRRNYEALLRPFLAFVALPPDSDSDAGASGGGAGAAAPGGSAAGAVAAAGAAGAAGAAPVDTASAAAVRSDDECAQYVVFVVRTGRFEQARQFISAFGWARRATGRAALGPTVAARASRFVQRAAANARIAGVHSGREQREPFRAAWLRAFVEQRGTYAGRRGVSPQHFTRNAALLAVGYRLVRRGVELRRLRRRDVTARGGGFDVVIQASKSRPRPETLRLDPTRAQSATCPVALLRAHLHLVDAAGCAPTDFLFASGPERQQLSTDVVTDVVREAWRCAGGTDEEECARVSGHSLRIGGATALAARGYSTAQIAALGLWATTADSLLLYVSVADRDEAAAPSGCVSTDMGL